MKNDKYISIIENDHESRITRLEVTIENINQTLARFDKRFDAIDNKLDSLNNRLWTNFFWTIGGFASILLIMAHGFEWV